MGQTVHLPSACPRSPVILRHALMRGLLVVIGGPLELERACPGYPVLLRDGEESLIFLICHRVYRRYSEAPVHDLQQLLVAQPYVPDGVQFAMDRLPQSSSIRVVSGFGRVGSETDVQKMLGDLIAFTNVSSNSSLVLDHVIFTISHDAPNYR